MTRSPPCKARQWSDEMVCTVCRLRWDMNDPDPPPCNPEQKGVRIPRLLPGKNPNPRIWRK